MSRERSRREKQAAEEIARRAASTCARLREMARGSERLIPPQPICEELHQAVERAAISSNMSMSALEVAVRRFTLALKDEGATPEAILISLKSVINARTFPERHSRDPEWTEDDLRHQISTWSIEEFFSHHI